MAKIMTASEKTDQIIKNVKYFSDLQIISAFHRKFPSGILHRRTKCIPDRFSLEMILNGSVDLILDGKRIRLRGPSVFWIGDRHRYFQFELIPGTSYEHYWIDFTGERGRRIYGSLCEAYPDSHIKLESEKNILPIFEYFTRKFRIARRPDSSAEDVIMLEQLMLELVRLTSDLGSPDDPHGIMSLGETIKNAPFGSYDVNQLAAAAGLSCVHFRNRFKKIHGEPLRQFILKQQMLTVGELLKRGQFRIGELADYCGFPDLAAFSRTFKRYYRKSPRQWIRDNLQNGKI